jgi:hypothetical protein
MIQFTDKLKLNEWVGTKCSRHPRYKPEKHDIGGWLACALLPDCPSLAGTETEPRKAFPQADDTSQNRCTTRIPSDSETRNCCQPPILRVAAKGGSESGPGWAPAVRQYKVYKTLAAFLKHDSCIGVRRNAYYISM